MNHLKTHQTNLMVPWDPIDAPLGPLNDDTKNLTETDTETFFPIPNFPKPIPRLFSDTKFSETDTETFFPIPNFPKPKPIPSKNWHKFRNREVSKPKCQSLITINKNTYKYTKYKYKYKPFPAYTANTTL